MKPEVEALLAGIPLMPATEQEEIFNRVLAIRNAQVTAALDKITAAAAGAPVDRRVAKFVQLRDARAASNKEGDVLDKAYKVALEAIEHSLIADAQNQGVTGFKTESGTTYIEERTLGSIADENAFFDFVRKTGDLDFFERRLKVGHLKEYAEANGGLMPPGLNIFRELTMKVRRS